MLFKTHFSPWCLNIFTALLLEPFLEPQMYKNSVFLIFLLLCLKTSIITTSLYIFLQKLHQPVNNIPQQDIEIKNNSTMFNPALYNPTMVQAVAEQQSRFYNQFYRTMAIAAVQQQQQQHLQQHLPKPPQPPHPNAAPQTQQQQQQQQRPKRRRTSAGNDPSAPPSHLSGEMIRRLREKQKMKNAAAVASAVASVAAVTTSGGRQFDKPQPPLISKSK